MFNFFKFKQRQNRLKGLLESLPKLLSGLGYEIIMHEGELDFPGARWQISLHAKRGKEHLIFLIDPARQFDHPLFFSHAAHADTTR